jgi:hypothetical protein
MFAIENNTIINTSLLIFFYKMFSELKTRGEKTT